MRGCVTHAFTSHLLLGCLCWSESSSRRRGFRSQAVGRDTFVGEPEVQASASCWGPVVRELVVWMT